MRRNERQKMSNLDAHNDTMLRVVDLFSGCGGMSKGFELAGCDVVAAVENWDKAAECYAENFNHPVIQQDLSDVGASVELISGYSPDLIIGGPPCQDFSNAGKRVEGKRANLTVAYARIVSAVRPRFFVMENVPRAQSSDSFQEARSVLKESGYGINERVLKASRCGCPQKRKRLFCVGVLGADDGFLDGIIDGMLSDEEMTVRDYLGDSLGTQYYYYPARSYKRRAVFSIDEPAPTMRGVNRPISPTYPGHKGDAAPISDAVRALTTRERALIQTFPPDFRLTGSRTAQEQMVGNAVPVNLAKFVATALLAYASGRENESNS